jgi:hypothetical protein
MKIWNQYLGISLFLCTLQQSVIVEVQVRKGFLNTLVPYQWGLGDGAQRLALNTPLDRASVSCPL